MSKEYQNMWPKFYELQDKAFESGDHREYNAFKKKMDSLGKEISELDIELLNEEKDYKKNLLGGKKVSRLKKLDIDENKIKCSKYEKYIGDENVK